MLSPNPVPNNPPEPIAYKLCTTCQPSPLMSANGFINVVSLAKRKLPFSALVASSNIPATATEPPVIPIVRKCFSFAPAINIIIDIIETMTIEALKWSCIKNNIPIGGIKKQNDFIHPFPKRPNSFLCSVKYPA